jgi:hypothetical protein
MNLHDLVGNLIPALLGSIAALALFSFFSESVVTSGDVRKNLDAIDSLVREDRVREALDLARALVAEAPNNLRARLALIDVLHKRGLKDEARRSLEALDRERPGHIEVRARLDTL